MTESTNNNLDIVPNLRSLHHSHSLIHSSFSDKATKPIPFHFYFEVVSQNRERYQPFLVKQVRNSCCFLLFLFIISDSPRISWARNSKNPVQLGTPFPSTCFDRHDASVFRDLSLLVRPKCIFTRLVFEDFVLTKKSMAGLPSKSSKMSVLI